MAVAIELEPDNAEAWYDRACVFALQEKIEEALTDLERALTLDGEKNSKACLELAKNDADFTSIQDDPRFRALLTKFDIKTASTGKSKKRHRA
jgi:tetratricopeptide (TPR) repeat protein